ncbi:iron complex transport system ATP-binding protein [Rhodoferax ferrireducens]|uniref:Iron complex transport system ATP-binding protein n=1 Tax=Rhodoferax ferrireducens TaxID=192843 RepID=A0ABU2C3F4_9BURK|nr:heme ABC transporter ATP-binding protein [Rhodoferax ferrireducens]MDR7375862.1 iron complex transport system ATP-binding protein [Rhodoferax ferrireducens]
MSAYLEARATSCRVGGATLLDSVSARFAAGQFTAILGPNGAGKSSLLSLLCGQRKPSQGRVLLDGQALDAYPPLLMARRRALLPQDLSVAFDYTVQDVVELGRYPHRQQPSSQEAEIVQRAMQATGVQALAQRVLNTLSGGERARAQLARVLAQIWEPVPGHSRWLLLDEPTAALDVHHQHAVLRLARRWAHEHGVGVVAVLHDLNLALRYADQVLLLQNGQVQADGPPAHVLSEATVRRIWQVDVHPVRDADGNLQLLMA